MTVKILDQTFQHILTKLVYHFLISKVVYSKLDWAFPRFLLLFDIILNIHNVYNIYDANNW